MPLLLVGIAWFALVMAATAYAAHRYWLKPAAYMDRAGAQPVVEDWGLDADETLRHPGIKRVIRRIGEAVPVSPAKARILRRRLMAAGFRSESAGRVMVGIQTCAAAGVGLLMFMILSLARFSNFQWSFLVSLLFAVGGYFLANEVLLYLIRRRRRILRHSLPDALDLLVICVESGLGLDQAILDVGEELRLSHPQLSQELSLVTLELRAGKRRAE